MEARALPLRTLRFPGRSARPLSRRGDESLARLVTEGDDVAFAVLYERYHQALYRYCRAILGNEGDAQDALQSALTAAFAALRADRRNAPLRPWLFRIAHNESITWLRHGRAQEELTDALATSEPPIEERAAVRERLAQLLADLHELPDRQRASLIMRELGGLSHTEIAEALEISPAAAKQTIFEARAALGQFAEGRATACAQVCRTLSGGDRRALRGRRIRAHLRHCPECAAFAEAIPARAADLRALAPPLAPAAATELFARLTSGSTGAGSLAGGASGSAAGGASGSAAGGTSGSVAGGASGSAAGGGSGSLAVGITGKAAVGLVTAKAGAGLAVVVAGLGIAHVLTSHHRVGRSSPVPARFTGTRAGGSRTVAAAELRRTVDGRQASAVRATSGGGRPAGRSRSRAAVLLSLGAGAQKAGARAGSGRPGSPAGRGPASTAGTASPTGGSAGHGPTSAGKSSSAEGSTSDGHSGEGHGQAGAPAAHPHGPPGRSGSSSDGGEHGPPGDPGSADPHATHGSGKPDRETH